MPKVGLIVNPVAGMGGKVGLKGTDGEKVVAEARRLGAQPQAPGRAREALLMLGDRAGAVELYAGPGAMGEEPAVEAGFVPSVVPCPFSGPTSARHTRYLARRFQDLGVDLLLFVGGDGTARDVYQAVGTGVPVLGIPAGVKIHSGAFAISPRAAGRLAWAFLTGAGAELGLAEVMDIDEEAFRRGQLRAGLFGYLLVPNQESLRQAQKSQAAGEESELEGAAADVAENLDPHLLYIVGPGSTTQRVLAKLGIAGTLLGVDAVAGGRLVAADAGERRLLELLRYRPGRILVTVIGGHGYIFGRGNQPISAEVIKKVGREGITVVAGKAKMAALEGRPLLVDTGDREADVLLDGYLPVVTGFGEELVYRVKGVS